MRRAVLLIAVASFALPATADAAEPAFEGPVARAGCGPGSQPEPANALQGEVTAADRTSGRSTRPYTCNMAVVGNDPGRGGSWQHTWYGDCAYYDTSLDSTLGTQVIDVSSPRNPRTSMALTSRSMLDPWESLSVNQRRGLLAGVYVSGLQGAAFFDVYDVKEDCTKPKLLYSGVSSGQNHEGDWAPDGRTYYATSFFAGTLTAIDVTNPSTPTPISTTPIAPTIHGLSVSSDGNRLYQTLGGIGNPNGLRILDVSDVQARRPTPQVRTIGEVSWPDGVAAQHTVPLTIGGKPHVLFVDEGGAGAARIIDITDETKPTVVSKLKLEIHMPANADRASETATGGFGYNAHYCGVDREVEPTIVVCSMFNSGMRVFDVRDIRRPREIAYYNPGGTGEPPKPGSQDGSSTVTAGYPSARPRIVEERGEIWFTDQNKGFFVARFTNGVWPFETGTARDLGLPPAGGPVSQRGGAVQRCTSRRSFFIRLRAPRGQRLRSASVYMNGRRVSTVAGRRLRGRVDLRGLPRGTFRVTVVARTTKGRTIRRTRRYRTCAPRRS